MKRQNKIPTDPNRRGIFHPSTLPEGLEKAPEKLKEKKCKDCGKEFKFKPHPNPKYERKYCDDCSKERKVAWENRHEMKFEDGED